MGSEMNVYAPPEAELKGILRDAKTIAVVGLSSNPARPSLGVAAEMQDRGYRIIPVNPNETEVLGEKAHRSLDEIEEAIDIVDVFRRPEETPRVAEQAVRAGAKVLWLQRGIVNDDARRIAEDGGLRVVMGVCIRDAAELLDEED